MKNVLLLLSVFTLAFGLSQIKTGINSELVRFEASEITGVFALPADRGGCYDLALNPGFGGFITVSCSELDNAYNALKEHGTVYAEAVQAAHNKFTCNFYYETDNMSRLNEYQNRLRFTEHRGNATRNHVLA